MSSVLETANTILNWYNTYIGGYALMILLVPAGIYFTFSLGFLHIRHLKHTIDIVRGKYDDPNDRGEISHFRALCAALSATVGTGNIVGVALAIYWGGPGAIFWMWVTGFFGMATKFVECTLSHHHRIVHEDGSISGGPMYYIANCFGNKWQSLSKALAVLFAIGTMVFAISSPLVQSNSLADGLMQNYDIPKLFTGIILSILVLMVTIGGIRRIAAVASKLVPIMAAIYVAAGCVILALHFDQIGAAFALIITDAFTGTAATGGFIGSSFIMAARFGIARGLFSNEAGEGSAPIAHAAAKTDYSVREGFVASIGPLIDTLIICTLTAFVIIFTGEWTSGLKGVAMTMTAFESGLSPLGLGALAKHIVSISVVLFAFSTVISYSYYGDRAAEYLLGERSIQVYRWVFGLLVIGGAVWSLDLVWNFADSMITLMTIPNVIALVFLFPKLKELTKEYLEVGMKRPKA